MNYSDYLDGNCTRKEYYAQFNPIQLEVGQKYVQSQGNWDETVFEIMHIQEDIAMAKEIKGTATAIGLSKYDLFYSKTGFRYNDNRTAAYQLKIINNK